jgi:hypothetical protein
MARVRALRRVSPSAAATARARSGADQEERRNGQDGAVPRRLTAGGIAAKPHGGGDGGEERNAEEAQVLAGGHREDLGADMHAGQRRGGGESEPEVLETHRHVRGEVGVRDHAAGEAGEHQSARCERAIVRLARSGSPVERDNAERQRKDRGKVDGVVRERERRSGGEPQEPRAEQKRRGDGQQKEDGQHVGPDHPQSEEQVWIRDHQSRD